MAIGIGAAIGIAALLGGIGLGGTQGVKYSMTSERKKEVLAEARKRGYSSDDYEQLKNALDNDVNLSGMFPNSSSIENAGDFLDGLEGSAQKIASGKSPYGGFTDANQHIDNVPTDYNNKMIQEALGFADSAQRQQSEAMMEQTSQSEQMIYDSIGRMQLDNENQIAQRRMQALRSGATSADLAAQELMQARTAQLGATQTAQQGMQARADMAAQTAGQSDMFAAQLSQMMGETSVGAASVASEHQTSDLGQIVNSILGPSAGEATPEQRLAIASSLSGNELSSQHERVIDDFLSYQGLNPSSTKSGVQEERDTGNYSSSRDAGYYDSGYTKPKISGR